jgi:hypothetical protein
MKKTTLFILLFLAAMVLWNVFAWNGNAVVHLDGDDIDGPLGALLATVFAGGGVLLAGVILMLVFGVLAVVFAGVGVLFVGVLALVAVVLAVALTPVMLPLLIPVAIVWYCVGRSRRHRAMQQAV